MGILLDFKSQIKAFPYNRAAIASSTVVVPLPPTPSLGLTGAAGTEAASIGATGLDNTINQLQGFVNQIPSDVGNVPGVTPPDDGKKAVGQDQWVKITKNIDIPGMKYLLGTDAKPGPLKKTLKTLNTVAAVLEKILIIISIFVDGFNAFSLLMKSIIELVRTQVKKITDDSLKAGVYVTMIAPEAFLTAKKNNMETSLKAYGGFQGFLAQLNTMLHNTKDKNCPPFTSDQTYIGGAIVLIDTNSIDEIWKALKKLVGMFTFANLFGLNFEPPPPNNVCGFCTFAKVNGLDTFGVKLEWDNPYIASTTLLSRSKVPGGEPRYVPYFPDTLLDDKKTGNPGLLTVVKGWFGAIMTRWGQKTPTIMSQADREAIGINLGDEVIFGYPLSSPEKLEYAYIDPTFNGGSPKSVLNGVNPTITYFDTDIKTYKGVPLTLKKVETDSLAAARSSSTFQTLTGGTDNLQELTAAQFAQGVYEPVLQLYYVVQSTAAFGQIKGPYSREIVVTIKTCNDAYATTDVVEHPNGRYSVFTLDGSVKLNSWSKIEVDLMVPWIKDILGFFDKFLLSLEGATTSASDSFKAFAEQLTGKIRFYLDIINVLTYLINQLQNFAFGPSFAFLNVPPKLGGVPVFMDRVRNAKLPPDSPSFSGPDGITIGLVIMYGAGAGEGSSDTIKNVGTAINFIQGLFKK